MHLRRWCVTFGARAAVSLGTGMGRQQDPAGWRWPGGCAARPYWIRSSVGRPRDLYVHSERRVRAGSARSGPSRHASRVALRGAAEAAHLRVQRASSFGGGRLELGYSNARARRYPVAHAPLNGVPKMCPGQLGAGSVATGATVVRFDRRPACTVNRFPGDRNWPRAVYWGIFQSRFSFNRAAVGRGSRLCRRRNLDCNLLPQLRKLTPDNLRSITC